MGRMSTNPAKKRLSSELYDGDEPGVYHFRVFYLCINGRRSVVGSWQLYETMRRLKLLNRYTGSMEFDTTVLGVPLAVSVVVGTWEIRVGAEVPAKATRASC
jgi:hypothetical protein